MRKTTKLIFFFIIFFISILFFFQKHYIMGSIFLFICLIPIFFIFRNEFLLLAFFKITKNDMQGLKMWLEHIKNPKIQLTKNQIAYYYFLNGIFYSDKNIFQSENYMNKALYCGLKFNQNIVIAKINLAIASLSKGDKRNAKILLMEAKKMDKNRIFKNQIQMIKMKMKKINFGKNNLQNPLIRNKY